MCLEMIFFGLIKSPVEHNSHAIKRFLFCGDQKSAALNISPLLFTLRAKSDGCLPIFFAQSDKFKSAKEYSSLTYFLELGTFSIYQQISFEFG